ncbi:MAG: cysteine--tRNA ligase [Planctomycetota bacterium]
MTSELPTIQIKNTLTGDKEPLRPVEPGRVKMYACGVTTYDYCHVGHALQAVFFDIIRKYLRYAGYEVVYVRNHTDVDDKIIQRAAERGMSPDALAEQMVRAAEEDLALIGVEPADHEPRVSESIPQIIAMVEELIENGYAYATDDGDVYYRVRSKKDYGKLSGRKIEELRTGTRDLVAGAKEFELDFALWKADETEGASWDSPWGKGRPGWHIECSAMAKEFLGDTFDIHGGGRDLVFPHHENEIAQSEAANGAAFANIWIHNGLVTIDKQKMSKSLGNHLLIRDAVKKWPHEVLRLSIISQHYGSNVDFSEEGFQTFFLRLNYYYSTLAALDEAGQNAPDRAEPIEGFEPDGVRAAFHAAMCDDFNTAAALAELNTAMRKANEFLGQKHDKARKRYTARELGTALREIGGVLGLLEADAAETIDKLRDHLLPILGVTREEIDTAIADRAAAREAKDYAKSDEIRDALAARGIELMDGREGTGWRVRPQPAS